MEYVVLLIIAIIIFIILGIMFDVNIKKIKQIGEDKELDILTQKYPENIEICKWYLRKLKKKCKIEEDEKSNATLYLVTSNKIFIANLKKVILEYKQLHMNVYIQFKTKNYYGLILYFLIYIYYILLLFFLLGIFKVLPYKMLFMAIFLILSLVYYAVRTYLENDAMIKARFLAKKNIWKM